jgi:response regulator of citrate/malate metabolism
MTLRVLVVEDEAIAAEAHAAYVGRVPGFEVAGVAHSGLEALRLLDRDPAVDLVLLDLNLPDGHGLALLQRLRAAGHMCDVIAVTSARDLGVVQKAATQGVSQYLLKPFTFAGFRAKLEQYASYRHRLEASAEEVVQDEVDRLLGLRRAPSSAASDLPKGMTPDTFGAVTEVLRAATVPLSASQVADRIGSSRVTARRYLEHLTGLSLVERQARYGGSGRPVLEYRWLGGPEA